MLRTIVMAASLVLAYTLRRHLLGPRTPAQTKASLSELNYARPDFPRGLGLTPSECARAPRRMYCLV